MLATEQSKGNVQFKNLNRLEAAITICIERTTMQSCFTGLGSILAERHALPHSGLRQGISNIPPSALTTYDTERDSHA